jgi:hypothetical protein
MPKKKSTRSNKGRVSEKAPKTYRLSARKIAAARRVLGTPTDTATIEEALDMVLFRKELVDGTAKMFGIKIEPFDD